MADIDAHTERRATARKFVVDSAYFREQASEALWMFVAPLMGLFEIVATPHDEKVATAHDEKPEKRTLRRRRRA